MPIEFINPISDARYRTFIARHPDATVFHTPEWIQVLSDTYGFKPVAQTVLHCDAVKGVIPFCETRSLTGTKRLVSLPYSDFCEPLVSSGDDMQTIIDTILRENNLRYRYIDFRGGNRVLETAQSGRSVFTHDIDCTKSEATLFDALRPSVKRNIRKAEKEKCTFTVSHSLDSLHRFYRMHCISRREHGLPPQPWLFFKNIWNLFIAHKKGFISEISYRGTMIAGALFLVFNEKCIFKFGTSHKKYLFCRPNDFMIWNSLLHCKFLGCSILNLGRTEPDHTGLLHFKRGWSGNENTIDYFRFISTTRSFVRIDKTVADVVFPMLFSKIPVLFLKPIGSFAYKYSG